jgi:CBS domain-containing protein
MPRFVPKFHLRGRTRKLGLNSDRRRKEEAGKMPRVREKMTSQVVTIEPQASVVDAAQRMIEEEKGPCRWWKAAG